MKGGDLYAQMGTTRIRDTYPNIQLMEELVEKLYPQSAEELALRISSASAGLLAGTMRVVGQQLGWDKVDWVSKAAFRDLGEGMARRAEAIGVDLPKDTRALAVVFITALYDCLPGFNFEIREFTIGRTSMRIFGVSSFFKAAKEQHIDSHISWPVIGAFFEGVARQLGVACYVHVYADRLDSDGRCDYRATFTLMWM
jgi:hypothetical protein